MISASDLQTPEYLRVPDAAKPTALGLWLHTDPMGRRAMDPESIAFDVYPTKNLAEATETVFEHLVMLIDAGFLTTYKADGQEWIRLLRPLKVDMRGVRILTPEPPAQDSPWTSVAMGRGNASVRAEARVRAEDAARADAWAAVRGERGLPPTPPSRPLLLDAPPIGCDEHPQGQGPACGPCRTARMQRDEWLARRIYQEKVTRYVQEMDAYEQAAGDDSP
ncbi:MAG: MPMin1 gp21 [Microbacterium sp.]|jgi:hypothetical protein|nr:MPMin1 gp21 [Microbacterium sp.]